MWGGIFYSQTNNSRNSCFIAVECGINHVSKMHFKYFISLFFASSRKNCQSSSSAQPQAPGENQWQLQHVKASKSMDLGTAQNQQPTGGETFLSLRSACRLHAIASSELESKACLAAPMQPMHLQPAGTDFVSMRFFGGNCSNLLVWICIVVLSQKNSEYGCFKRNCSNSIVMQ